MTPEDRFPGPEHPHSGPRHQPDLDVLPYGTYYEPEPATGYQGAPYDAETYSGYGGARYLEQHWPVDGQGHGHTVHAQGTGTDHGPVDQSAVFSHQGQGPGDYEDAYETAGYEGGYDAQDHPGYEPTLPDQPSPV
ncbi:hypothetical protein, partial [Kitasatospora aureofaciens]|uniref:hypothetical protein n=1 Tax=Kitasatospora aureofaciens TaxID=1894 RepID=UPI00061DBFE2